MCSIDFTCAQMITSAISVASDGATNLSLGATYGILLAILFSHGVVCSAATTIIARLNLFYVLINGECHWSLIRASDPSSCSWHNYCGYNLSSGGISKQSFYQGRVYLV